MTSATSPFLNDKITFTGVFIERETVLKTGTTAAGNIDTQPEIGVFFLLNQAFDLSGSGVTKATSAAISVAASLILVTASCFRTTVRAKSMSFPEQFGQVLLGRATGLGIVPIK